MTHIKALKPDAALREAKRIWLPGGASPDEYAEFKCSFRLDDPADARLEITGDSCTAVWVNGALAFFTGCGDYPWYKLYDRVDISQYCRAENEMTVEVWYFGEASSTYYPGDPGVAFAVVSRGKTVLTSGKNVLCRKNKRYRNGYRKKITGQLGFSFRYDATVKTGDGFSQSAEYSIWENFVARETEPMRLTGRVPAGVASAEDGYLVDLGEERVGFLDLEFLSPASQDITIVYGEHLTDGRVRRRIGERDFSVEYAASEGKNSYMNPFRRIAGRYLQIECERPLDVVFIGLRETVRPVDEKPVRFADPLDQRIYDTAVNTLKKCMHEHYEDCPWREQAMYTMDSRNQMLCGYEAFEGFEFQRQNLLLTAQGQRKDGLLSLCFPAGIDIPIPFFSLVYIMQIAEYVKYSGDRAILDQLRPTAERIIGEFAERVEDDHLIANFPYPYWNFYEWEKGSDREEEITRTENDPYERRYDLILNAMYVHAARIYGDLYGVRSDTSETVRAIDKTFFVPEKGLYKLSTSGDDFSVLGNSMALLIGLGGAELAKALTENKELIPVSLSMSAFFYDALLAQGEKYKDYVLSDIRRKYKSMLDEGCSTFWETEKGWRDFGCAGSLCHGWSAIPVYYLKKLLT